MAGLDQASLESTRAIALEQPILVNRLLSPDSKTTGINITVELPPELTDEDRASLSAEELIERDPQEATSAVVAATRALIADMKTRYPEIDFTSTGVIMMNQAFPEASIKDITTLIPVSYTHLTLPTTPYV